MVTEASSSALLIVDANGSASCCPWLLLLQRHRTVAALVAELHHEAAVLDLPSADTDDGRQRDSRRGGARAAQERGEAHPRA